MLVKSVAHTFHTPTASGRWSRAHVTQISFEKTCPNDKIMKSNTRSEENLRKIKNMLH